MDNISKTIIEKLMLMDVNQRSQFNAALKEILMLPELDAYLESNASAIFKS